MQTRLWSAALLLGLTLAGLAACGGASTAPTATPVPQQETPSPSLSQSPAATATAAPSPTPTPWPISIPPNVTLDIDPSLTATELAYLRQTISDALRQASIDFETPVPAFTLLAYRSSETILAGRMAWEGITDPAVIGERFDCDFCATTGFDAVFLRLGPGWFDDSAFPRQVGRLTAFHEVGHVYQYQAIGAVRSAEGNHTPPTLVRVYGPAWLAEGSAQWWALRTVAALQRLPFDSVLKQVANFAASNSVPLQQMESPAGFRSGDRPWNTGAIGVDFLLGGRSPRDIARFYAAIGRGEAWESAFANAFGPTTTAFYESFAAYRQTLPASAPDASGGGNSPTGTGAVTIAGTLSGPGTTLSTPVTVRACLWDDAQRCWPATLTGESFSVAVPPRRYVLSVSRGQVLLGYQRADGLTKDRPSAIVIDTTSTSVSGIAVIVP